MKKFSSFVFYSIILSSCLSSPNFQSAQTIKKQQSELYGGFGLQRLNYKTENNEDQDDKIIRENINTQFFPGLIIGYRRALESNMDYGIELGFPGRLFLDIKKNLLAINKHFLSYGLGFGFMPYGSFSEGSIEQSIIIPLYYSFQVSSELLLNTSTRYHYRHFKTYEKGSVPKDDFDKFYIFSFGLSYKNYLSELTITKPQTDNSTILGLSFGYKLNWGKTNEKI